MLVDRLGADHVAAVDPSEPFVDAVRTRLPGVDVRLAPAEELPFADASYDVALAQLVVHFMADPVAGLREMGRVTRAGGVVAACVWDHAGDRGPLSTFWTAVRDLDPAARGRVRALRVAGGPPRRAGPRGRPGGHRGVELTVDVEFESLEDWWTPYTLGVGPAGAYVAGLDEPQRDALRDRCAELLPEAPFTVPASPGACGPAPSEPGLRRGGAVEPRTTSDSGSSIERAGRSGSAMASSSRRAASAPIWWCGIAIVVNGGRSLSRNGMSLKPTTLMSSGQVMPRSAKTS